MTVLPRLTEDTVWYVGVAVMEEKLRTITLYHSQPTIPLICRRIFMKRTWQDIANIGEGPGKI